MSEYEILYNIATLNEQLALETDEEKIIEIENMIETLESWLP